MRMRGRIAGALIGAAVLLATPIAANAASAPMRDAGGGAAVAPALGAARFEHAVAVFDTAVEALEATVKLATEPLATARATLEDSAGSVLAETNRTALAAAIQRLATRMDAADVVAAELDPVIGTVLRDTAEEVEEATGAAAGLTAKLAEAIELLDRLVALVEDDVAAWRAEQDRLAAEAEAAAALAAPVSAAGEGETVWDGVYRVYVVGWVDYTAAQPALDSGGQWAIDYRVGVINVSAHNFNDATALDLAPGDIVEFSGAMGGRYVVTGDIWVPGGTDASALWALGTPVAMQTCAWGSTTMRLVGLSPI